MKKLIFAILLFTLSASASETIKGAQKDFESFKTEMSAKLETVQKQIIDLQSKAKEKGDQAQGEATKDLQKTRDQLQSQLNDMQDSGTSNWRKFKKSFGKSVDQLNTKIQKAVNN